MRSAPETSIEPHLSSAALRQQLPGKRTTTSTATSTITRTTTTSAIQPQIIRFARQYARYVRLAADAGPISDDATAAAPAATSRFAIRKLSVTDSAAPTTDLALRKDVSASSSAAGVRADARIDTRIDGRVETRTSVLIFPFTGIGSADTYGPSSAVDGNPCTSWSPDPTDARPWIQLDLGKCAFFDQVSIVSLWEPILDGFAQRSSRPRVSVSQDGQSWTGLTADDADPFASDPFSADPLGTFRTELGTALPPCLGAECEPLHAQADPATWQVFAVNHTALRVAAASLTALVYDPFGKQLNEIEQRGVTIEPLCAAPCFVVAWPAYLPHTHLLSLRLHDADGALLSEENRWRHRPAVHY